MTHTGKNSLEWRSPDRSGTHTRNHLKSQRWTAGNISSQPSNNTDWKLFWLRLCRPGQTRGSQTKHMTYTTMLPKNMLLSPESVSRGCQFFSRQVFLSRTYSGPSPKTRLRETPPGVNRRLNWRLMEGRWEKTTPEKQTTQIKGVSVTSKLISCRYSDPMWTDHRTAAVVVDIHLPTRPLDSIPVKTQLRFDRFLYYNGTKRQLN